MSQSGSATPGLQEESLQGEPPPGTGGWAGGLPGRGAGGGAAGSGLGPLTEAGLGLRDAALGLRDAGLGLPDAPPARG